MLDVIASLKHLFGFARQSPYKSFNILIVDDSVGARKYTERVVRSFMDRACVTDYAIEIYSSYEEYAQGPGNKYDIAFIDWNLGSTAMTNGDGIVKSLIDNAMCEHIVIFSGMVDDSPIIAKFSIKHDVNYIHKGDPRQEYKLAKALEKALGARNFNR